MADHIQVCKRTGRETCGVCAIIPEYYVNDRDHVAFILISYGGDRSAKISISGLEEIQNSSRETIQDPLDGRFAKALAAMETGGDSAGN